MKIEDFLHQFEGKTESVLDDQQGKILVNFNGLYFYEGCTSGIINLIALYDEETKEVKSFKMYGVQLESMEEYIKINRSFLGCSVIHYLKSFEALPQTILIITSM